jgi:hypothetical protein
MTALAEHGIHIRREQPGEHRTACSRCAEIKHRPRDEALAVKLEADGAATWYCHRCGWKGGLPPAGEPRKAARPPLRLAAPPPEPAGPSTGLSCAARRLWKARHPLTTGSPPARYFRGRGCTLPVNDVGWLPSLPHPSGYVGPCVLALVTDVLTGEAVNVHRTCLAADGSGKAPVDKPRLLLKGHRKKGGVVRLWPDEDVTAGLCVAEGVETALTAALGFGLAWAVLDAGNLGGLPVLPGVEALTIVADHDEAGVRAADACGRRWAEAGREVRVWKAPTRGADLNDHVREAVA